MVWVGIMATALVLAMLTFAFLIRYFIHIERMALIQHGLIPPALANPIFKRGSFGLLLAGLITAFSGLGITIGFYIGFGQGIWLAGGVIPIGVGFALILAYLFSGHSTPNQEPFQKLDQEDSEGDQKVDLIL